jgi:hypothetical protein
MKVKFRCGVLTTIALSGMTLLWAQSAPSKADLDKRQTASKRIARVESMGDHAVAVYRDRLEFFQLEIGESVDGRGRFKLGNRVRTALEAQPLKIVWFERPFNLIASRTGNVLVCSAIWASKNSATGLDEFCGVVSASGDVIYKFPVKQHAPDAILHPLAISDDGSYAEVYLGRLVPGEDGPSPGSPREILAWRSPSKLTRLPGPWKNGEPREPALAFDQLLQGFKERKERK